MKTSISRPDRCIACTTCTVVCPVSMATPQFLGPRMMGPGHERFRLVGLGEDDSLHYCSNCKNCDISCPCDVPVSTFIMRARAEVSRERRFSPRDWMLAHGEVVGRLLQAIPARLKNFGMGLTPVRLLLEAVGIARNAPLPEFAAKTFRREFASFRQPGGLPRKAVFFPGCFVDMYDPRCGMDIVWVLNRAGYEVIVPDDFVCCGLPLVANGFWEDARTSAQKNLAALKTWKEQGIPVLTGCTSCSLMFKEDYAQFFPDLLPQNFSPVLADVCEFLLDCLERGVLTLPEPREKGGEEPARGGPEEQKGGPDRQGKRGEALVLYHAPCHLRAQGMGLPGLALLRSLPGVTVRNADAGCCGISGSYGFKKDKYPIAMRVGAALFKVMRESGADIAASECGTCRLQMTHGGGLRAVHPVTFVRQCLERKQP